MLSVIDEATSPDLATLATVKAALSINGTGEDATLKPLITQASVAIARCCNRTLIEETVEESIRTFRRDLVILLERYPITEIISMTENGVAVEPADRELDSASGCLNRLCGNQISTFAQGQIVVRYTAGYPIEAVPPDLVQAVVMLVALYRSTAARDPMLRAVDVIDVEKLEYFPATSAALPGPVLALIEPHRKAAGA